MPDEVYRLHVRTLIASSVRDWRTAETGFVSFEHFLNVIVVVLHDASDFSEQECAVYAQVL